MDNIKLATAYVLTTFESDSQLPHNKKIPTYVTGVEKNEMISISYCTKCRICSV